MTYKSLEEKNYIILKLQTKHILFIKDCNNRESTTHNSKKKTLLGTLRFNKRRPNK